ncbi:putative pyrrolo-quinoline quinone [Mycobacterium ulcerans str. Harvey]|uniref:Pyrrolo-quinoline quinone n=1 Tax=Mycobacterium ulcerans str. Harvey TaxID=1299332 RepID=A0ABP3AH43_MYCUL|nr:putative pyrrolo-quinoline quinone [Mycobacterium ulcerans str. Harvey]
MEWENNDNGRQRWCVRLVQGGGFAGPLFDGFDNLYVGQPGAIVAFPVTQWTRWRQPVIGMPSTPRFLGNGHLLVATHLGQMLVFDAHRGKIVGSPMDLVEGVDPTDPARGLADCAPARQGCPVAAAPAFSKVNGMVVVGIWQPGAPAAGWSGSSTTRSNWFGSGPATPSKTACLPVRCYRPTAKPCTSTAATNGCGPCTQRTAR